MLTLTSRPGTTVRELMRAWNRFRGWLRRRLPELAYAAVKERGTLHGMLHLHIIVTGWTYITQGELSEMWRKFTRGAFRVDIRRLYGDDDSLASYVAKYLAKALGDRAARKSVTYSRNWPPSPKRLDTTGPWKLTALRTDTPAPWLTRLPGGLVTIIDAHCECMEALSALDVEPIETNAGLHYRRDHAAALERGGAEDVEDS